MKLIITILLLSLYISCSPGKKMHDNDTPLNEFRKQNGYTLKQDSVYIFRCKGKEFPLKGSQLNRAYFPGYLAKCLVETGFEGDEASNRQIADIIQLLGVYYINLFRRKTYKFRGPEIFEALLIVLDDHSPARNFDGELSGLTRFMAGGSIYLKMIDHIDGKDANIYINERMNLSEEEKLDFLGDESMERYSQLYYKTLMAAWREGKVVLKGYGQE